MTAPEPHPSAAPPHGWEEWLDPGETLLWQGAPMPGFVFRWVFVAFSVFGVPFLYAGLSTFAVGVGVLFGGDLLSFVGGLFLIFFSLPFAGAGAAMVAGPWMVAWLAPRRVRYALSDRRAFLAQRLWRRSLRSALLDPDAALTLEEGRNGRATVRWTTNGGRGQPSAFESIADGRAVLALMRAAQRALRAGPGPTGDPT